MGVVTSKSLGGFLVSVQLAPCEKNARHPSEIKSQLSLPFPWGFSEMISDSPMSWQICSWREVDHSSVCRGEVTT